MTNWIPTPKNNQTAFDEVCCDCGEDVVEVIHGQYVDDLYCHNCCDTVAKIVPRHEYEKTHVHRSDNGDGTYTETSLLDQALEITSGDRRRDYGRPLINHLRIALQWSNYLGITITPEKVVWMMIGLKQAREAHTPKYDNLLDTVGYSLCLDDMWAELVELGYAKNREEAMAYMASMTRGQMTDLLERLEKPLTVTATISSDVDFDTTINELRRRGIKIE